MFISLIIIIGLVIFEIVNSVDNAIVNAHMLKGMSPRARQWFLIWGILIAVFVIRGVLPFLILYITVPGIPITELFQSFLGKNDLAKQALEASSYILLMGGGIFLFLLYFHWLFLEKKESYFVPEKLVKERYGIWFFAVAAISLVVFMWLSKDRPLAMLGAATGNAVFFILYGFRQMAEREEHEIEKSKSDLAKLLFLEVLDASFSIDGVLGAFAFTINIILILIGNGIGAFVVRQLTIYSIEKVALYKWLKNGAMTSIGFLGLFMILKSFGVHIPEYLPTLVTVLFVGVTFFSSHRFLKNNSLIQQES